MDDKKKERPIMSFFKRKFIQVSKIKNPKPSDTIKNDSSDQACSTTKRSRSTTASIEPSSGNVNFLNADLSEKPHQPKLKQFLLKEVGKQKRSFNPKWFDEFKFLHYREESDSVICHTCAVADKNNLLKIDTKKEKTFTEIGFSNWKKAIERFLVHGRNATHIHATQVLTNPSHIDGLLPETAALQKVENWRCLMKVLENIAFLGKQVIALRGDSDDKTGYFYQLLLLQSKDDPALLKWISKTYDHHITPQAQNEMPKLLALKFLRKIATDIRSSGCYSILAD